MTQAGHTAPSCFQLGGSFFFFVFFSPVPALRAVDAVMEAAEAWNREREAAGLAPLAYLVAVTYAGGGRGHMLAFVGAVPGAEGL